MKRRESDSKGADRGVVHCETVEREKDLIFHSRSHREHGKGERCPSCERSSKRESDFESSVARPITDFPNT